MLAIIVIITRQGLVWIEYWTGLIKFPFSSTSLPLYSYILIFESFIEYNNKSYIYCVLYKHSAE